MDMQVPVEKPRSREAEKRLYAVGIVARFGAGRLGEMRNGSPQWFFDDSALGSLADSP
jgi:hypothetical protein